MNKLNTFRTDENLTVSALATRLGISQAYMSRILRGDRKPGGRVIARIEEITAGQVTSRDFYTQENPS
jgi:transcriptional regulator with XRE-family HTH domain